MKKGNLPNLSRHLCERGTHQAMLTAFPSTTGPAYLPFLTGCFPGTCNVPGIRWFDRGHYAKKGWSFKSFRSYVGLETYLFNRDMSSQVKTAYEIFKKPVSILNNIHRGIPKGGNKTKHGRIWYIYYAHLTDHWSFVDDVVAKKTIAALDEDPDFVFLVFPSVDEYSHRSSVTHPRTLEAYRNIDAHVGRIVEKLKSKGMYDDTLMVLVSDHGLSDTHTHFDVGPYLESKGIKTFFYTQIFKRNFKAASMVSGNGMSHLYFKTDKGWAERATFEYLSHTGILLDELRMRPEVDLVASLGADGSIHLQTEKGHSFFKVTQDGVDYHYNQSDALGIFSGGSSVSLTWEDTVQKTWDSHYPDVFKQLEQVFRSPRSGDVIVTAKSGFDLRERYEHPEHKASHGSLCPEHMFIPFLMNAPVSRDKNRSVDVFPTILSLMGKEIPNGLDGVSLV